MERRGGSDLTKAVDEEMTMMHLRIPYKEIMAVFRQEVRDSSEYKATGKDKMSTVSELY